MSVKTYGELEYKQVIEKDVPKMKWVITALQPHVSIKLKSIFTSIPQYQVPPFEFADTTANCHDLLWFTERYPLSMTVGDASKLCKGSETRVAEINKAEAILLPDYVPSEIKGLKEQEDKPRPYQLKGNEILRMTKRLLLADDIGLGKTLTSILGFMEPGALPAAVVAQAHLPTQWKEEIEYWTHLKVHIIKTKKAYTLPPADVYIFKYTSLTGWVDLFATRYFKYAIFDECQELRRDESDKYASSEVLSINADYVIGLSATPIYNYGGEIFNVMNLLNPGCLGTRYSFENEWGGHGKTVKNPEALGTYLREGFLLLRRTRAEVGRELPPVNKLVYTVDHDEEVIEKDSALAKMLAIKVLHGNFEESGKAALQLDMLARRTTGLSKAVSVAAFVKMLLSENSEERIVLVGWHRDVYDIWNQELKEFNPVMYTGSESPKQKRESKEKFINGDSRVFILSLRSGIGLDGLQYCCRCVVFGELDWSPKVHDQVVGRVDRDRDIDDDQQQVTAIYLVSSEGSDPVMIDVLGIKAHQAHGIVNPLLAPAMQYSDESRIKKLAENYLKN